MALTTESQTYFNEIVAKLTNIGGLVSSDENLVLDNSYNVNWEIKDSNPIGGFSYGDIDGKVLMLFENPFSQSVKDKCLVIRTEEPRGKLKYVISPNGLYKKAAPTTNGSGKYWFTINNEEFYWTSSNEKSTYNIHGFVYGDPDGDGIVGNVTNNKIYIIQKKNGYSDTIYCKSVKIIEEREGSNLTIPFYKWYKKGNKLWIGTKIDCTEGMEKKSISGWFLVFSDSISDTGTMPYGLYIKEYADGSIKEVDSFNQTNLNSQNGLNPNGDPLPDEEPGNGTGNGNPSVDLQPTYEWENSQDYLDSLTASDSDLQFAYWQQLYTNDVGTYSLKSHRSIIGLPLQFMSNVDMRVGSSTYGKQFMEDILYDMSIACIKPGGPVLNPNLAGEDGNEVSDDFVSKTLRTAGKWGAYFDAIKNEGFGNTFKQYIFTLFKGGGARFYSFQSDYTHYIHYVNTLCHMFIAFLGIGDKYYTTGSGIRKQYAFYNDSVSEIETDGGLGLHHQFGWDEAVHVYYSPESQLSHTFSNSTTQSSLNSTLAEASAAAKEWGFFINAAGFETGKAVSSFAQDLVTNATTHGGLLGKLFSNASEGVTTVLAGNNLSLPEIYSDSETTVQHTFKIKLASPYGDPESVFSYVLRPLARLLAFSLPRQYGPNSYMSPFIIQAFSKGQFNCQLGIVTNLSVTRCGNGGESHTINHIPTELEVTLEIQDMYEKVFLSNEYFGNSAWRAVAGVLGDFITGGYSNIGNGIGTALAQTGMTLTASRLIFNNVGLIDFCASFCGANLNQPNGMSGWTFIWNMMKNRSAEIASYHENDGWKFPQWEKTLNDAFNDATTKLYSSITTTY